MAFLSVRSPTVETRKDGARSQGDQHSIREEEHLPATQNNQDKRLFIKPEDLADARRPHFRQPHAETALKNQWNGQSPLRVEL